MINIKIKYSKNRYKYKNFFYFYLLLLFIIKINQKVYFLINSYVNLNSHDYGGIL